MTSLLSVPQGQFHLQRLPLRKNELLQAWDAADEYLLRHLAAQRPQKPAHMLICNDSFGALAVALQSFQPVSLSDSFVARQALQINLQANGIPSTELRFLDSLGLPDQMLDVLLIKAPKTLALLEYQLHRLRPFLDVGSQIVVAGMVKAMPSAIWQLLESLIGPTTTSLASKKARLIFARLDPGITLPANPYPRYYNLENSNWRIANHANVFSRDSLDIGTRFLLQHLPESNIYSHFIDLGCGNGLVGLMLASQNPDARVSFVDESYMAVASAQENFANALPDQARGEFVVGDALAGFANGSADCVVCNPPFHQQQVIGDQIAWQMFRQAHKVLRVGGELRVIGNRHLNYPVSLKKLFGNCRQVAANAKFVIVSCQR